MRITKELAKQIATNLTQKRKSTLDEDKKKLKDFVTELFVKSLPKDIIDFHKTYPGYIRTTGSVNLHGVGLNHDYQEINETPSKKSGVVLRVDDEAAEKINDAKNNIDKESREVNTLKRSIENALISLGTYKRAAEAFPEAAPYLVENPVTAVTINVNEIRKQLNHV